MRAQWNLLFVYILECLFIVDIGLIFRKFYLVEENNFILANRKQYLTSFIYLLKFVIVSFLISYS